VFTCLQACKRTHCTKSAELWWPPASCNGPSTVVWMYLHARSGLRPHARPAVLQAVAAGRACVSAPWCSCTVASRVASPSHPAACPGATGNLWTRCRACADGRPGTRGLAGGKRSQCRTAGPQRAPLDGGEVGQAAGPRVRKAGGERGQHVALVWQQVDGRPLLAAGSGRQRKRGSPVSAMLTCAAQRLRVGLQGIGLSESE